MNPAIESRTREVVVSQLLEFSLYCLGLDRKQFQEQLLKVYLDTLPQGIERQRFPNLVGLSDQKIVSLAKTALLDSANIADMPILPTEAFALGENGIQVRPDMVAMIQSVTSVSRMIAR